MRGSFNKLCSNGKLFLAEDERKFAKFDMNMQNSIIITMQGIRT
jgi:hypothetical protein